MSDLFNANVQSFQQYHGDLILAPELVNTIELNFEFRLLVRTTTLAVRKNKDAVRKNKDANNIIS